MRARTVAVVRPGGVLGTLHCEPPLTLRRVTGPAGTCALCLVGTAAGPLAGDDLALDLHVEAGADASLQATGASIAQGRGGTSPAALRWRVDIGAGGRLRADPGPLVIGAGSRVDVALDVTLASDVTLDWQELIVLGRTGESPGAASLRWDVVRAGRPLLRQHLDLTDLHRLAPTGGHRVIATALLSDPALVARTAVLDRAAAAQRLAEDTVLLTVLGDGTADVRRRLARLRALVSRSVVSIPSSAAGSTRRAAEVGASRV